MSRRYTKVPKDKQASAAHKNYDWAWANKLPVTHKMTLLALAKHADNETGEGYPRVPILAEMVGVSGRTIQRILNDLAKAGLLEITHRFRSDGWQTTNNYLLCRPDVLAARRPSPDTGVTPGLTQLCHPCPDTDVAPAVTELCQPSDDTAVSPQELPLNCQVNSVEVRTEVPPLRVACDGLSVLECHDAGQMLIGIGEGDAQLLIDELQGALNAKIIQTSPLRWFKAVIDRYREGCFRPSLGLKVARDRDLNFKRMMERVVTPPTPAQKPTADQRAKLDEIRAGILARSNGLNSG